MLEDHRRKMDDLSEYLNKNIVSNKSVMEKYKK